MVFHFHISAVIAGHAIAVAEIIHLAIGARVPGFYECFCRRFGVACGEVEVEPTNGDYLIASKCFHFFVPLLLSYDFD